MVQWVQDLDPKTDGLKWIPRRNTVDGEIQFLNISSS